MVKCQNNCRVRRKQILARAEGRVGKRIYLQATEEDKSCLGIMGYPNDLSVLSLQKKRSKGRK